MELCCGFEFGWFWSVGWRNDGVGIQVGRYRHYNSSRVDGEPQVVVFQDVVSS